jgi:hypothetical protein
VIRAYGSVADLTAAPVPESRLSVAFCPRCHQQYQADVGSCADCLGVALRRFEPSGAAAVVSVG